jgi:hypothetical protein
VLMNLERVKPGGILHGQGQGVYTTRDESGEMASWTGYGVGHITGSGRDMSQFVSKRCD